MSKIKLLIPFIVLIALYPTVSFCQIQNTWIGGYPGSETNWNCHKNWSKHKVPDEFSNVVIPDTRSTTMVYPIIEHGVVTINSLYMHADASLFVMKKASLVILDKQDPNAKETQSNHNNITTKTIQSMWDGDLIKYSTQLGDSTFSAIPYLQKVMIDIKKSCSIRHLK